MRVASLLLAGSVAALAHPFTSLEGFGIELWLKSVYGLILTTQQIESSSSSDKLVVRLAQGNLFSLVMKYVVERTGFVQEVMQILSKLNKDVSQLNENTELNPPPPATREQAEQFFDWFEAFTVANGRFSATFSQKTPFFCGNKELFNSVHETFSSYSDVTFNFTKITFPLMPARNSSVFYACGVVNDDFLAGCQKWWTP